MHAKDDDGAHHAALPPLVSSTERRGAARKRALRSGVIVYGKGDFQMKCTISDISNTGARIRLAKGESPPDHCYLIDIANRTAYAISLRRWQSPVAGTAFVEKYELNETLPPELAYLKRIFAEVCLR